MHNYLLTISIGGTLIIDSQTSDYETRINRDGQKLKW